jgi:hypothetical protein
MATNKELESAVYEMATLANGWRERVTSLAGMALTELDRPPTAHALMRVVSALQMIASTSGDIHNCIDVAAERVGLNFSDERERARSRMIYDAMRPLAGANEKGASHAEPA